MNKSLIGDPGRVPRRKYYHIFTGHCFSPCLDISYKKSCFNNKRPVLSNKSLIGDPGRVRTCNRQSRNLIFYPVELRDRLKDKNKILFG